MNIEPDIFDYLETTSLEPHDDYTSEVTYKDQKIIWNKLKEQDKEIERLKKENTILRQNSQYLVKQKDELEELINKAIEYINTMPLTKGTEWYRMQLLDILEGVDKECK